MRRRRTTAFTIIELLVVVSIVTLLVGILLPAIGNARDQARVTISAANLRNLATAHGSYAAEWNDRQLTFINDNASNYGDYDDWFENFAEAHGSDTGDGRYGADAAAHPMVILGWGHHERTGQYILFGWYVDNSAKASLCMPVVFRRQLDYLGTFRLANAAQFHQYVGGRFYDPVFYAPRDRIAVDAIGPCADSPDQFCRAADIPFRCCQPAWTSYCLSPAAMFSPDVFAREDPDDDGANGWTDPWTLKASFRAPAFSQCTYPSLKTHMLEHHWLQGARAACNPAFSTGSYGTSPGCEPYYFNHAWASSPVTLFYDGHVESVGVRRTMRADGRLREQSGHAGGGLWSRDTPWGEDGYRSEIGYDQAHTSFHILTTEGIRGRDVLAE